MTDTARLTPAMDWLLREASTDYGPNGIACVYHWSQCPFAVTPSYEEKAGGYVANDPSEAHYDCTLLGEKVWGEYPKCTEEQWRERARIERAGQGRSSEGGE